jgi:hypothetical protein
VIARRAQLQLSVFPIGYFLIAGAAAQALLGSQSEARAAAPQAGLALDPTFTMRGYRAGVSSDNTTFLSGRESINEGMPIAGVPEGSRKE